jgi:hypothetical protein
MVFTSNQKRQEQLPNFGLQLAAGKDPGAGFGKGLYGNHTPGDSGLLGDMEESWGSTFEALNNSERLWMLFSLVGNITADASENYDPSEIREYTLPAIDRLNELSFSDQLGLAQALIEQIKHYRHRG